MKSLMILLSKFMGKNNRLIGKLALKLDKKILSKLTLPRDIIVVTGSNGKSSTVEFIVKGLETNGDMVVFNKNGDITPEDVVGMILQECSLDGNLKKDKIIIECNIDKLEEIINLITIKYLVVTNIYRQGKYNKETLFEKLKNINFEGINLILNADDEMVLKLGYQKNNVTYFGYSTSKENSNIKFAATNFDLKKGEVTINKKYKILTSFKSMYVIYNILAGFSLLRCLEIQAEKIVQALNNYQLKCEHSKKFLIDKKHSVLINVKYDDSASYNYAISYITRENKKCAVCLYVNSKTNDTSWVWDVNLELINNQCIEKIILCGEYSRDMLVRFSYSNIDINKIIIAKDISDVLDNLSLNTYFIANYKDLEI